MRILKQDQLHGAALAQIVKHSAFTSLNKASDDYGHYLLNDDVRIHVKYCAASDVGPWQFTFHRADLTRLSADLRSPFRLFVCLVCGASTVCLLSASQVNRLLDVDRLRDQHIKVASPPGCSMRVSGSGGALDRTVPHSSFPGALFDGQRTLP